MYFLEHFEDLMMNMKSLVGCFIQAVLLPHYYRDSVGDYDQPRKKGFFSEPRNIFQIAIGRKSSWIRT